MKYMHIIYKLQINQSVINQFRPKMCNSTNSCRLYKLGDSMQILWDSDRTSKVSWHLYEWSIQLHIGLYKPLNRKSLCYHLILIVGAELYFRKNFWLNLFGKVPEEFLQQFISALYSYANQERCTDAKLFEYKILASVYPKCLCVCFSASVCVWSFSWLAGRCAGSIFSVMSG